MGEDLGDLADILAPGEKAVMDGKDHLPVDLEVGLHEGVEGVVHHALGGVLDGNDPVGRLLSLHAQEDLPDGGHREMAGGGPKNLRVA
jgi:hypothetical protein